MPQTRLAVILSKIVRRVVSHIIFTSYARRRWRNIANRMFDKEHSFLMRRYSLSTSEILVPTGGGHFELFQSYHHEYTATFHLVYFTVYNII